MGCPNGHATEEGDLFCGTCGAPLAPTSPGAASDPARRRWTRTSMAAVIGAALLLSAIAVVAAVIFTGRSQETDSSGSSVVTKTAVVSVAPTISPLASAFEACSSDDVTGTISLGDDGRTILVDTGSEFGATQPVRCLFAMLGTSDALVAQVQTTTAMMGQQEAVEGAISYRWSYHPDNGLNLIITTVGG